MNLENFLSAFIGAGAAIGAVIVTYFLDRRRNAENKKSDELAFISSIKCELHCITELMDKRHGEILNRNFNHLGIIDKQYFIRQSYLAFFDQNMSNLSKISDDQVRLRLQKILLFAKAYIDSIHAHNSEINTLIEISKLKKINPNYDSYEVDWSNSLKQVDEDLVELAINIKQMISELIDSLSFYSPKYLRHYFWT